MQRRQLFATAGALALSLSTTLAAAQPRGHDNGGPGSRPGPPDGRGPGNGPGQPNGRGPAPAPAQRAPAPRGGPVQHQAGPGRGPGSSPGRGPGAGPDRRFHRGDRLPPEQRRRQYVVDDWRRHRLSAPPRGHHWVQSGADYLLVAIATGLIAQIVLHH